MITYSKQSGFSLVETLVAITILLIVIVGPMTLAANATRSTNFSSEQVIGFFLAQEGAELAQKARDDILLPYFAASGGPNAGWDEYSDGTGTYADCFNDDSGTIEACGLSIATDLDGTVTVVDCAGALRNNCRLYLDDAPNKRASYTHTTTGNVETIYWRTITMRENTPSVADGQEIQVVSRVTWRTGEQRQEQSAEVVTYLYNVYGR